jgi:hypothetical protein
MDEQRRTGSARANGMESNNQSDGAEALRSDAAVSGWVMSSLRCGKGEGVAGEVQFIGAQPGSDRRGVPIGSHHARNQ